MTVMGVSKFERFFRAAASLDVDRNDLKRYGDFVDAKLYDLLVAGQVGQGQRQGHRRTVGSTDHQGPPGEHPSVPAARRGGRAEADPGTARRTPSPRQGTHPGGRRALPRDHRRSQRRSRRDVRNHVSGCQEPADQSLGGRYSGVRPAAVAVAPRCVAPPRLRPGRSSRPGSSPTNSYSTRQRTDTRTPVFRRPRRRLDEGRPHSDGSFCRPRAAMHSGHLRAPPGVPTARVPRTGDS